MEGTVGGGGPRPPPPPGTDTFQTGPMGGLCCVDLLIYLGSHLQAEGTPWSPHHRRGPGLTGFSRALSLEHLGIPSGSLPGGGGQKQGGRDYLPDAPTPVSIPAGPGQKCGAQNYTQRSSAQSWQTHPHAAASP